MEKVPECGAGDAFLKWQAGSQTANKSKVMKRVHATVGILCAHPVSLRLLTGRLKSGYRYSLFQRHPLDKSLLVSYLQEFIKDAVSLEVGTSVF